MRLIKFFIFLLLCFSLSRSLGQVKHSDTDRLDSLIQKSVYPKDLPDSTGLYTGFIKITIDPWRNYIGDISISNPILASKMQGLETLRKFNYRQLLKYKRITSFIIPIAITTISFKDRPHAKLEVDSLATSISKMFQRPEKDRNHQVEYLQPIIISVTYVKYY